MRFGLLPAATLALFLGTVLASADARADIAFLGANSDDPDNFAFVALSSYAPLTVLNFVDSNYGSIGPGESTNFRWAEALVSGPLSLTLSTTLNLGQVVIYDATDQRFELSGGVPFGLTAGGPLSLSITSDNIFAYRGTVVEDPEMGGDYRGDTTGVTSFEGALLWGTSGTWQTSGVGTTLNSYLPATPNMPFNYAHASGHDNVRYNGARNFSSIAEMRAALANADNWAESNSVVASPTDFGGDFVVAVPEASAGAFGGLAGLAAAISALYRRWRAE